METIEYLFYATMTSPNAEPQPTAPEAQTDAQVFGALRSGDLSALGILYDRYGELVYRLALRILGTSQEAEDLTQEVFLTLYRRPKYNGDRGSLNAYLMTLTRSRSIDHLRSKRSKWQQLQRWSQPDSSLTPMASRTPLEQASLMERADRVKLALQSLPANQRQVLELSYYEGLSQSEIAQRLNWPLGTVKTRARQGLLKLRNTLQNLVE